MKTIKYTLFLTLLLAICSCGGGDDPVDETNPTVIIKSPTVTTNLNPGDVIAIDIDLSDNIALDDYVLNIAAGQTKSAKNIEEFSFNSYTDTDAYGNPLPVISGKKTAKLNFDIAVKDNVRVGFYVLTISVRDKSDNATEESEQIVISRP